eukprot:TRINITY_DN9518_c0_g1_i1.p1 TRINITY_DN9518_c0_g1~~TRINITY_DN9518_c0_g1_i1.p1  ORF type:complete len:607 (-),score=72.93 TRINITY_DN9518_c0_g1_i1:228-2048(-)
MTIDAGRVAAFVVVCVCLLQVLTEIILDIWKLSLVDIKKRLQSIPRSLRQLCQLPAQAPANSFEKRLRHLLEIERIDRWHLGAQYLAGPALLGVFGNLATRGFNSALAGVQPLNWAVVLGSSFPLAVYVSAGSQFCRLVDRRFSKRANSAVVTYMNLGVTLICGISQAFNTSTRFDYAFAYYWTLCGRMISSIMDGKLASGVFTCIAFTAWSLYCRVTMLRELRGIDCILEFSSTLVICGVLWFGSVSRYELMKRTLEAKESRNFQNVGVSLLLKTCDAVVQLSDDFCITAPTPSLSALLLRQSNMEGLRFVDLIQQNEAVERFLRFMMDRHNEEDELLLPLRDSDGSAVNVRIMGGHGLDSHDQVFHIIGIQEVCSQNDNTMPAKSPYQPVPMPARSLHDADTVSVSSGSSLDVLDEVRSTCSDTVQIDFQDEQLSVWLQLSDGDNLKILKCSAALSSIIGLLHPSTNILERLRPSDVPSFMEWIQGCLNAGRTKVRRFSFELPGQGQELRAYVVMEPFPLDMDDVLCDQNYREEMSHTARPEGVDFKLELLEVQFRGAKKKHPRAAREIGIQRSRDKAERGTARVIGSPLVDTFASPQQRLARL